MLAYNLCSLTVHLHNTVIINHTVQAVDLSPFVQVHAGGDRLLGQILRSDYYSADAMILKSAWDRKKIKSEMLWTSCHHHTSLHRRAQSNLHRR